MGRIMTEKPTVKALSLLLSPAALLRPDRRNSLLPFARRQIPKRDQSSIFPIFFWGVCHAQVMARPMFMSWQDSKFPMDPKIVTGFLLTRYGRRCRLCPHNWRLN